MYGDGSLFSYAIAAQQAWPFHWHNISGRLFTYVYAYMPAEAYVALTSEPKGGIALYGVLFFAAPLLGLMLTWASDRSPGRVIFGYACLSTSLLCPLVFGVPTEMWMAHSLFWPTLTVCFYASPGIRGGLARFAFFLALVFTHEGAVVFSLAILFMLFLNGPREKNFRTSLAAWIAVMAIWLVVKIALRPDDYIAGVLVSHAFKFIDPWNFDDPAVVLLLATLTGYAMAFALLARAGVQQAPAYAAFGCAGALALYWLRFDTAILAEARYELRTALLFVTPPLGFLAIVHANPAIRKRFLALQRLADAGEKYLNPQVVAGAVALVLLVHAVETSKFVRAWTGYKAAVETLATGSASDPELGDRLFVSSRRIGADLNRLAWNSTTPYLSVLVAPGLSPRRLVVDPTTTYFWLPCATAETSEKISTAVPAESRRLVRLYSCLHR